MASIFFLFFLLYSICKRHSETAQNFSKRNENPNWEWKKDSNSHSTSNDNSKSIRKTTSVPSCQCRAPRYVCQWEELIEQLRNIRKPHSRSPIGRRGMLPTRQTKTLEASQGQISNRIPHPKRRMLHKSRTV
ncbi:hypothetical protein CEXT_577791 [Caerostris extrusa]|uniref:Secreted protein n=1 Tax=Caerostris extrusa TaxID=172846 RepID=A0AAV4XMG9_CAEEX|nr:hypothetical protein CEXT_577791 [Caerostris extrusa]